MNVKLWGYVIGLLVLLSVCYCISPGFTSDSPEDTSNLEMSAKESERMRIDIKFLDYLALDMERGDIIRLGTRSYTLRLKPVKMLTGNSYVLLLDGWTFLPTTSDRRTDVLKIFDDNGKLILSHQITLRRYGGYLYSPVIMLELPKDETYSIELMRVKFSVPEVLWQPNSSPYIMRLSFEVQRAKLLGLSRGSKLMENRYRTAPEVPSKVERGQEVYLVLRDMIPVKVLLREDKLEVHTSAVKGNYAFKLGRLPAGKYKVTVWDPQGNPIIDGELEAEG